MTEARVTSQLVQVISDHSAVPEARVTAQLLQVISLKPSGDGTATPAATAVSIVVPAATPFTPDGITAPAATAISIVVPSATITLGDAASPSATVLSIVVPQATPTQLTAVTPAATVLSAVIPAPTILITLDMSVELTGSGWLTAELTPAAAPAYSALSTKTVGGVISA